MFNNQIIAGSSGQGGEVQQSLKFNDDESQYLSWTPASAGNRKTFTLSMWFKLANLPTSDHYLFGTGVSGSATQSWIYFNSSNSNKLTFGIRVSSSNYQITIDPVYRDPSAWYHLTYSVDTTQSTASDRVKIYVNGSQVTDFVSSSYPPQNSDTSISDAVPQVLGANNAGSGSFFDGYLSDINFIDGQALDPTSFGETIDGYWRPVAYSGSYGSNGFHLDFDGNTNDASGNGNNWTANNISAHDYVPDSPTNNFATFNALNLPASAVLSEGNLKFTQTLNDRAAAGNMAISSGKWYFEVYYTAGTNPETGLAPISQSYANSGATGSTDKLLLITNSTGMRTPAWSTTDTTGLSAQTGTTILGFAVDADNGKMFISANGTYFNSGDPAVGTNPQGTFDADWLDQTGGGVVPFSGIYTGTSGEVRINFGQDSTFAGAKPMGSYTDDSELGTFQYQPPVGFKSLCSANLPATTSIDGSEHFNTVLFNANNSTQSITGVTFRPDWVWTKSRANAYHHGLYDSVRGVNLRLRSSTTDAEVSQSNMLNSFDADGFSLGQNDDANYLGSSVAWNWKAGGAAVSNTDGSITSQVSANVDAGFSIVSWTGTGSAGTIGHSLGVQPSMIIVKNRIDARNWSVWHKDLSSNDHYLRLDSTDAQASAGANYWNSTAPTSSVFSVGVEGDVNDPSDAMIAYCFANSDIIKAGSYTGNGSSDGAFVYTGGRVQWLLLKDSSSGTSQWLMMDNTRDDDNPVTKKLGANISDAENSTSVGNDSQNLVDFLSNGFKLRTSNGNSNASGGNFVYLAIMSTSQKHSNAR